MGSKLKSASRRKFLIKVTAGTAVVLGTAYLTRGIWRRAIDKVLASGELPYYNFDGPLVWFEANANNEITFYSPKVEMGQGVLTALAQIVADELQIKFKQLKVLHASSSHGPLDLLFTGDSSSIEGLWKPIRELAATFRQMFIIEAAKEFKTLPKKVKLENGVFSYKDQTTTYGELVKITKQWKVPSTPDLKNPEDYQYIGKAIPRLDLEDKVTGKPIFSIDEELDGMVYAIVVPCPYIKAKRTNVDPNSVNGLPGIVDVIVEEDFVAVVAESRFQAYNASQKLAITWEVEEVIQQKDIEEMVTVGVGKPYVIQKGKCPKNQFKNASEIITSEFRTPMGAHAQIQPSGALANFKDGSLEVYVATQNVRKTRKDIACRLNMRKKKVNVLPAYLGGAFGRALYTDLATYASFISRQLKRPVHCFYTRAQEFQADYFRPPTHHLLKAVMDDTGHITAFENNCSSGDVVKGSDVWPEIINDIIGADFGAWRGALNRYGGIQRYEIISWRANLPLRTSFWRGMGLLANIFAIESFMDELAEKVGIDPVTFRQNHLNDSETDQRLLAVLNKVVEQSSYTDKVENGIAMGLACCTDGATHVAQVVRLSIEAQRIIVSDVYCVIDTGMVINPDQVKAQCEGNIIMGMSAALYEKVEIHNNAIGPLIYGPYKLMALRECPENIEIHLMDSDRAPQGLGEPPMGPIAAAIANATYKLTGNRIRRFPMNPVS
ncbi:MAG: xanthine dehydrogenase family protein molybdopterin-binding subunit [Saprospiraceae bacterium]|nr:xanthine dehydrogenase family protein molybdopterin-binding subunit [Saprospiraceae bacterium]